MHEKRIERPDEIINTTELKQEALETTLRWPEKYSHDEISFIIVMMNNTHNYSVSKFVDES